MSSTATTAATTSIAAASTTVNVDEQQTAATTHTTTTTTTPPSVSEINIPKIWLYAPLEWLQYVNEQFDRYNITDEQIKYFCVLSKLANTEARTIVTSVIVKPYADGQFEELCATVRRGAAHLKEIAAREECELNDRIEFYQ